MLHKALSAVVCAHLILAPLATADEPPPASPIAAAAAQEAARAAGSTARGPMRPGMKWTGIGFLIGSGLPIVATEDCLSSSAHTCRNQQRVGYATAGAMAITGATLLLIAHTHRPPALPTIVLDEGRAVIQHRLTF